MQNTLNRFSPTSVIPRWQDDPNARLIAISKGRFAVVGAQDFEQLSKHGWSEVRIRNIEYAQCTINRKAVRMHRLIMNAKRGELIDHWNTDGLDNRRMNLRRATRGQNQRNMRKPALKSVKSHSQFKGVARFDGRRRTMWRSKIVFENKPIYLGSFPSEIEAALTYDKKARELFGEFALCNFS